jgi:hypothetical protein
MGAQISVALLHLGAFRGADRPVARWHHEVGGALEHVQLRGLLRDDGDGLHARGTGADHGHPSAAEIDARVGPLTGVVHVAAEALLVLEVRHVGAGQAAHRGDEEARIDALARVGLHHPALTRIVEVRMLDTGVELDVAAEIEAVRDVVGVGEELRLRGIALGPVPLLLQRVGEGVGVLHALDVAATAGVAVPVPGAADAIGGLENPHRVARLAQLQQHVHAAEAGADHHGIVAARHRRAGNGVGVRALGQGSSAHEDGTRSHRR